MFWGQTRSLYFTVMEMVGESTLGCMLLAGQQVLENLAPNALKLDALVQCQPNTPCRQINPTKTYEMHLEYHDL